LKTIIAIPACHFESAYQICATTKARLVAAIRFAQAATSKDVIYVVSGDVPYYQGGTPLNHLMRSYLVERGVIADNILLGNGLGIADDSKNVVHEIAQQVQADKIIVVSSDWYLWAALPFWRLRAKTHNITLGVITVPGTGGWRTWLTYLAYGTIIRISFVFGLRMSLERALLHIQNKRRSGFQWNGCA
jgi:hypothetical protein